MQQVHEEISDLLSEAREDRFSCVNEARKKAMDFLARREYGQTELTRKLAEKGYERGVAEQAVLKLTADRLQCDARFAEAFVQSRVNQGKGPVRIRLDLGQRGVAETVIEAAIDASATNWQVLAREVRVRKFGEQLPTDFKAKAKQMRFLQYRGFEQTQVHAALAALGDE